MKLEEKIEQIEKEIRETPYHKATEHHIGRLRARLAQLRDQQLSGQAKKGGGGGFGVKKNGDATVVLVGPPSVGKSSLINVLTEARSPVAEYAFTTLTVIPGMMDYKGAKIQIFDIPGIIEGASLGRGRGREVLSVARTADLLLLMLDVDSIDKLGQIKKELAGFGLRLDEEKPRVSVNKKNKGGLKITSTASLTHLSRETIKAVAQQFRLTNAELVLKEDITQARLIDALMGNRVYLPYLVVVNKTDLRKRPKLPEGKENLIYVSVRQKEGLTELRKQIWRKLDLIRAYLKPEGGEADLREPLILKKGETVGQAAARVSVEMANGLESARVWGSSVKYGGQKVSLAHRLQDRDILSFSKK